MSIFSGTVNTLNIESDSLRLLSLQGRTVKKWGEVALSPGLIKAGQITDHNNVSGSISGLFKGTGVSKNNVVVGVTSFRSIVRLVSLPKLKGAKLKEAVMWAAHKEMPVPLDSLYVVWQALGWTGSEQQIFVLGVPKDIVDSLRRTLYTAGVSPKSVESKSLALTRLAGRDKAILIDVENETITTILQVKGIPAAMQTTLIQPENTVTEDRIQRLTDGLFRIVEYYNDNHPEQALGADVPVYLTGGLVDAEIMGMVKDSTKREVLSPDMSLKLPEDMSMQKYGVNIGLGLKDNAKKQGQYSLKLDIRKAERYDIR